MILPRILIQLFALVGGTCGYTSPSRPPAAVGQRRHLAAGRRRLQHHATSSDLTAGSFAKNARSAARTTSSSSSASSASSSSTVLNAGLRDLVGPYDDEYGGYGRGGTTTPYDVGSSSIRDERNGNSNNFGSGGFASGGSNAGAGRRNSPGFVEFGEDNRAFGRDGNYPDYDVVIEPMRGGPGRRGNSNNINNNNGARIFDKVDFDDLPGSSTRRIGNYGPYGRGGGASGGIGGDPYDRGLDSDFINGGSGRNVRGIGGGRRDTIEIGGPDADFNRRGPPGLQQMRGNNNINTRGGGGPPQIYRRDYLDTLDGRSFNSLTAVEQYFEAWNRRNIPLALSCFDDAVYYDDTQFAEPFEGKDKLADHLLYVADCLPDSFYFVVDELSVGRSQSSNRRNRGNTPTFQLGRSRAAQAQTRARSNAPTVSIGALWHIENEFGTLPFARGCSFFKIDPSTNLIVEAYDFPEPAVIKTGSTGLRLLSVASKLVGEPRRWFPFFAWIVYVYVVYFSNGILPGKDIFHASPKTWDEVQNLSFNFMFIAPATHMPTAAKLNPVLEGLFNGLLAWGFMFAGFLSDERSGMGPYGKDSRYYETMVRNQEQVLDNGIVLVPPVSITKKNLIPLVPTIIGMQFFMSAFLLPYLFARTSERYSSEIQLVERGGPPRRIRPLYKEELDRPALVLGEWRGLGVLLGAIGIFALYWGFAGRPEDFGPPIWVSDKRMVEFMKLLDKDRVAASFVVDLWVFGIFQGWLVDDDWKRRGRSLEEEKFLRNVAKFVPFFGLASYLVFRPRLPTKKDTFDYDGFFNRESNKNRRDGGGGDGGFFGGDDGGFGRRDGGRDGGRFRDDGY